MASERWRQIPDAPGYEVSDLGNVRSWHKRGRAVHTGRRSTPYVLKPFADRNGYLRVNLRFNTNRDRYVHQLVLEAFAGPCPHGQEARHVSNRDPRDNKLSNLAWGTKSQNQKDRRRHGTDNTGHRNGMSKLTNAQRRTIRESIEGTCSLAKRMGVSPATVVRIRGRIRP